MSDDVTPIRQQYLEIKKQYPDTILLFRLGDFYETFDEDAEITSRELDIVLTSRPIGKGLRAPLAGIPYHALENYLGRLVQKGYHVAICEQVGDQPAKGIFPRKVIRVVTPGTVIEPGLLPEDKNNYLSAVVYEEGRVGIAYVDISTGEFATTEIEAGSDFALMRAELARINSSESIFPNNITLPEGLPGHLTAWPSWRFELGKCRETLLAHFGSATLEGFGIQNNPLAVRASGGIMQYLKETDADSLNLFSSLHKYSCDSFMTLDASTRWHLELTETMQGKSKGSLLGILDKTITPMGKRLIRQWINQPLLDLDLIRQRQEVVGYFAENGMVRAEFRNNCKSLVDLERIANRILSKHAIPRDLVSLRETLKKIPDVIKTLRTLPDKISFPQIENLVPCSDELNLLENALSEDPPATLQNTGIIHSGYSAELDGVIEASKHARDWINNLETTERQRTGIKSLKVSYNKVFGYYIEISHSHTSSAPENYIRKQTLVNAERYITPEMKEYETLVLNAEERIREIELRLFQELCTQLGNSLDRFLSLSQAIAELDVTASFAETAALDGYIKPEIFDGRDLEIEGGRHPVVEQLLPGERFVPNDVIFENDEIIRIITGPNMSGKSTYLRQTALIVLMAQIGSYVPAVSAKIGLVDRIFTRIGAQDEIHSGQSTFMVEMIEVANILHHATEKSLLILDEVGRGTSTYDGVSIAWAVVEYIHNNPQLRSKTLFATHYHELTQLADVLPGVKNYNVAVSEVDDKVVFLHKIIPGGADRSYGIHVAQLAGLPRPVVQRALEILVELEKSSGKAIHIQPQAAQQIALFPETNPLIKELRGLDINSLSPIEAINKLFEWQKKYTEK